MPGPKKMYPVQIAVRLTAELVAKLDKLANGATRSDVVRALIRYATQGRQDCGAAPEVTPAMIEAGNAAWNEATNERPTVESIYRAMASFEPRGQKG